MIEITTRKVVAYQVNGKGKCHRHRGAAYRWAAIAAVNARCTCDSGVEPVLGAPEDIDNFRASRGDCRFCRKQCDGQGRGVRHLEATYEDASCEADQTHSYRYRLIGRLARWLMWRDARGEK